MFDVIVVGARCAGAPTAMLLARHGHRVLLVDKCTFPSDIISTHVVWPHGAERLERWGLLDRVAATGCPPVALNMTFDVGPFALKGGVFDTNGGRGGFCPRRTLLDKILVDGAVASGAELREGFTVERVIWDDGRVAGVEGRLRSGAPVKERARVVVGADGMYSVVARAVGAPEYDVVPARGTFYYSYYSGFAADDLEQYVRDSYGAACFPTNDGLTLLAVVWPRARFHEIRADIEGHVRTVHESIPAIADRLPPAQARGEVDRNGWRRELLPQTVRTGLGTRRRCRLRQGPAHRAGHQRRVHRRRESGARPARRARRPPGAGRGAGRVSTAPRRARAADVRVHVRAGEARAAAGADAAAVRRAARQPGGDEPVLLGTHGVAAAAGVHEPRKHRTNRGRRTGRGLTAAIAVRVRRSRATDQPRIYSATDHTDLHGAGRFLPLLTQGHENSEPWPGASW